MCYADGVIAKDKIRNISHTSGVYMFRSGKTPLYIGKAADLRKRLVSYFRARVSAKTQQLIAEADALDCIETTSEIDALIQEARLIKKYRPKYNVLMRDDKNYFYVGVTKEEFPRILITHQPHIGTTRGHRTETGKKKRRVSHFIGPFTSGSALKIVLRMLRSSFPYCTCAGSHKRPCLNAQIGRCLGFCCYKINSQLSTNGNQQEYTRNIKNIIAILSGKRKHILSQLKRDMRTAAKKQDFELAGKLRDQLMSVQNIFSHRRVTAVPLLIQKRRLHWERVERAIQTLLGATLPITRVEGYDISNVSGKSATGSMVVFINGAPEKSAYRHFKIKTVHWPNDIAMHREVMQRRLLHTEWSMPDLIVIDGGKPQLNAIQKELRHGHNDNERIHLTALAKREEELFIEGKLIPQRLDTLPLQVKLFFQHVRDESHRFAKKYHHKLREIEYRT